mmetsp:Transcript_30555/g.69483  ORF Transcript_30555/g.69483 Transcript_30555/m.69483 type:complete len:330 (-) Transcript_30555:7-996(-)
MWTTPAHAAHLLAGQNPLRVPVKLPPERSCHGGVNEVDEGVPEAGVRCKIHWEVDEVVQAVEALVVEHGQDHGATVAVGQVPQHDGGHALGGDSLVRSAVPAQEEPIRSRLGERPGGLASDVALRSRLETFSEGLVLLEQPRVLAEQLVHHGQPLVLHEQLVKTRRGLGGLCLHLRRWLLRGAKLRGIAGGNSVDSTRCTPRLAIAVTWTGWPCAVLQTGVRVLLRVLLAQAGHHDLQALAVRLCTSLQSLLVGDEQPGVRAHAAAQTRLRKLGGWRPEVDEGALHHEPAGVGERAVAAQGVAFREHRKCQPCSSSSGFKVVAWPGRSR